MTWWENTIRVQASTAIAVLLVALMGSIVYAALLADPYEPTPHEIARANYLTAEGKLFLGFFMAYCMGLLFLLFGWMAWSDGRGVKNDTAGGVAQGLILGMFSVWVGGVLWVDANFRSGLPWPT